MATPKLNIDLSKVKKEYLLASCAILIVAILFLSYNNIFKPLLGKIKQVSEQIEQTERDIQRAKVSPDSLKGLEAGIEKLKARIDYYQRKLTSKVDVPQILKELNQMAEPLRIKIVSVNPLAKEEISLPGGEEFIFQVPIRISLKCGYHQLGIFINKIENSPRFMKIADLKINAVSRDIWAHDIELVITSYGLGSKESL